MISHQRVTVMLFEKIRGIRGCGLVGVTVSQSFQNLCQSQSLFLSDCSSAYLHATMFPDIFITDEISGSLSKSHLSAFFCKRSCFSHGVSLRDNVRLGLYKHFFYQDIVCQ